MIEYLFLLIACAVLFRASKHDYKTHWVELATPFSISLCGFLYMIYSGNNIIDTIGVVIITAFIFAIPTLFSFGVGDFLIFVGLALFIDSSDAFSLFLGIFLVMWVLWTIYLFHKFKVTKKEFLKIEYPLVPVIAMSFYIWIVCMLLFSGMA